MTVFKKFGFEICNFKHWSCDILERYCSLTQLHRTGVQTLNSNTGVKSDGENEQDGNVPSRRHILGSKIFKEQLLEKFGKKNFFSKKKF